MSKNSIILFLKDYLIKYLTRPILLDTNDTISLYRQGETTEKFVIKQILWDWKHAADSC